MTTVIHPSLTDQMVLGVFKYLVEAELRKNLPNQVEFRSGCQEGMIAMLGLMFGTTNDQTAEAAYNDGNSWIHVVQEIQEDLQDWVTTLENADIGEIVGLQDAVDKAVNQYALKHPKKLGDALRINL